MTDCSSHCGDVTSFLSCIYMLLFCVLIQFLSFPNLSLSCTFMTKEEEFTFVNSVLANKVHDKLELMIPTKLTLESDTWILVAITHD